MRYLCTNFLIFIFYSTSIEASNGLGYTHRPATDKPLYGSKLNPVLILNNNNPPVIKVKPSILVSMEFETEVERCSSSSSLINITKYQEATEPTKYLELTVEPKVLEETVKNLSGKSIFTLPAININCRFSGGGIGVIMVKLSQKCHAAVYLTTVNSKKRDYSAFTTSKTTPKQNKKLLPTKNLNQITLSGKHAPKTAADKLIFKGST